MFGFEALRVKYVNWVLSAILMLHSGGNLHFNLRLNLSIIEINLKKYFKDSSASSLRHENAQNHITDRHV